MFNFETKFSSFYLEHSQWNCLQMNVIGPHWVVQWASYQIRKIAGYACAGSAGNVFHATDVKGNRLSAISACFTHVPVMHVGIANPRWRENIPGIPGPCAKFTYLARGPWHNLPRCCGLNNVLCTVAQMENVSNWRYFDQTRVNGGESWWCV